MVGDVVIKVQTLLYTVEGSFAMSRTITYISDSRK